MDTTNIINEAEQRGYKRGAHDALCLAEKQDYPLGGEWAGESLNELLGDLLALAENQEHEHETCVAYEDGYSRGYDETLVEEMLRMENQD
jgi:hypothetical protein